MRQAKPTTYALMCRCELGDAAKVRTLAEAEGVTMSVWVARLVHEAVRKAKASPNAKAWATERLAVNTERRKAVDERVHAGCDRKPGWNETKRFSDKVATAADGEERQP